MDRKDRQILRTLAFSLLVFFAACVKDEPNNGVTPGDPVVPVQERIYVLCEGSLGNGNSALDLYNPKTMTNQEDVYKIANGGQLGDVLQSMQRIGDSLFLCVNNSDKVTVLHAKDHKLMGTISVPKPRYILPVNDHKAYVSTLFSDRVYVIDPKKLEVTKIIYMPAQNPEGMLLVGKKALVCCWDTANNSIYRIDTATDAIEKAATLAGFAPQEIVKDKEDKLWVLAGNVAKKKTATLTRLDATGDNILMSYTFPAKADPIRPVFNNTGDVLHFIEVNYDGGTEYNGIYKMGIHDAALPTQPFVAAVKYQYFWALGIEPGTDKVYVGDPKGFVQKGSVTVYDKNGDQIHRFNTGAGPGHFYFDKEQ